MKRRLKDLNHFTISKMYVQKKSPVYPEFSNKYIALDSLCDNLFRFGVHETDFIVFLFVICYFCIDKY